MNGVVLYVAMSIISNNPRIKAEVLETLRDAFGDKLLVKTEKTKIPKTYRSMESSKLEIYEEKKPISAIFLINGFSVLIIAYLVYLSLDVFDYTWLTRFLCYTLIVGLAISSALNFTFYFYVLYKGRLSFSMEILRKMTNLVYIPWLILANIFTSDLQVSYFREEFFENSTIEYVSLIPIPVQFIPLAKFITILLIMLVILDILIALFEICENRTKKDDHRIKH